MTASCPELHELLALESKPPGDAARRHLEECPRCRNRLALYASFLEPGEAPAGADVADAERRLTEALDHARRAEAPAASPSPAAGGVAPRRARVSWRPAWALAGLLLAGAIVLVRAWSLGPPETGVLRSATRAPGATATLRLEAPAPLPGGAVRLAWAAQPGADAYEVRVLGPDLALLTRREVAGTSLELGPDDLAAAPVGAVLGWKVTALRAGERLAVSTFGTLRRP